MLRAVQVMYILTLGVLQHAQQRGVGSSLLAAMRDLAAKSGCCSAFLHVIDYNAAAIRFYQKHGFQELALMPQFYFIGCVATWLLGSWMCSRGFLCLGPLILCLTRCQVLQ